jgi:hypothetical protein
MLLPLLLSLATLAPRTDDPLVSVRLNHEQFEIGDRARVYVQAARDGYLAVLHADPQGRIRVLFPLDPTDDNFIRGDRKFELRGRSDREPLQMDAAGTGTVIAIFSVDPLQFDELMRNGHWDYAALGGPDQTVKNDPLAGLLEIANNLTRGNKFDYDEATYVVHDSRYASDEDYDGYGHAHVGFHFGFGYYPFGFGYAFGYPYYSPFAFVPFYPYYPYYPGYGYPAYRTPVIYGGSFAGTGGFTRKGTRGRFGPTQPRPRLNFGDPVARPRTVSPRGLSIPSRSIAPRSSSFTRSFGGVSRSFGGFNRSFGGSRGGFSTGARRR